MNASSTRNKQNHTCFYWEPFATSTPLKIVPNNLDIGQVFQRQLLLHGAPVNIVEKLQNGFTNSFVPQNKCTGSNFPKRSRKNSSAYLDVLTTSSSDEDESGENKKRPIIRLSSRRKTRTLVSFKNLEREETEIQNKGNPENKLLKTTADRHAISAVKDFRHKSQSSKDKDEIQHPTTSSSFKINSFSSDEENKIFGETKPCKKKILSPIDSCLKGKENGDLDKYEEHELKGVHKMSIAKAKSIKGGNFEEENGPCETVFEGSEVIKASKKKIKKLTNTIGPLKRTRVKKISNKLPAEPLQSVENTETLLPSWKRNLNLSHQLFSDSREQEFINKLDLTREENNEAAEAMKCSLKGTENVLPLKSLMSPHPSIKNICSSKVEPERPKRTKQPPKKFWLPENAGDKPFQIVAAKKQKKVKTNSNDLIHEAEGLKKLKEATANDSNPKNNTKREHAYETRRKKISEKKVKKAEKEIVESCNGYINDINLKDSEQNHPVPKMDRNTDVESKETSCANTKDIKKIHSDRPVFKKLSELSCTADESGFSIDHCWKLNNFKCGTLRLKIKNEFAGQTLHKNSYLGGVLVKGDLRMKIGDKDLHLKEGDMAFVPPLTKWQATNIGDCESIFYYWSGIFTG